MNHQLADIKYNLRSSKANIVFVILIMTVMLLQSCGSSNSVKTTYKKKSPATVRVVKTINWYINDANKGNKYSQFYLGNYYFDKKSFSDSYKYYLKAAKKNHSGAQLKIGLMYALNKIKVDSSFPDSKRKYFTKYWVEKSKSNGNSSAHSAWKNLNIDNYYCLGDYCQ